MKKNWVARCTARRTAIRAYIYPIRPTFTGLPFLLSPTTLSFILPSPCLCIYTNLSSPTQPSAVHVYNCAKSYIYCLDIHMTDNTETAPLVKDSPHQLSYDSLVSDEVQDASSSSTEIHSVTLKSELKLVLSNGLPLILSFFSSYLLSVIPIVMTGHLSTLELGASSLAIMFMNVTYLGVIEGTATAIDSFAPHAFGANNLTLVGDTVQKNTVIMTVILTPMVILCYNSELVLNILQPNEEISRLSQLFIRVTSLGVPGLALFQLMQRYLQAQNIFQATTYVLFIVCPLNLVLCYLLIFYFGLGFIGAPITMAITYWLMALLLFLYIVFIDGNQCWGGLNKAEMTTNLKPMFKIALAGVLMVESEYFAFEIMTLLSSYFGEVSLASQSICSSIGSLLFQIPFALSSAISTRTGQLIGSGNKRAAIRSAHFFMISAVATGTIECLVLLVFKKHLIYIFTNDPDVVAITSKVLPILFATQCYDFLNVTCAGLFRSQSRLTTGSMLYFFCYYLIGIPLSYVLAFIYNLELFGLWVGLTISVFILTLLETAFILNSDWDKIIEESKTRTSQE